MRNSSSKERQDRERGVDDDVPRWIVIRQGGDAFETRGQELIEPVERGLHGNVGFVPGESGVDDDDRRTEHGEGKASPPQSFNFSNRGVLRFKSTAQVSKAWRQWVEMLLFWEHSS